MKKVIFISLYTLFLTKISLVFASSSLLPEIINPRNYPKFRENPFVLCRDKELGFLYPKLEYVGEATDEQEEIMELIATLRLRTLVKQYGIPPTVMGGGIEKVVTQGQYPTLPEDPFRFNKKSGMFEYTSAGIRLASDIEARIGMSSTFTISGINLNVETQTIDAPKHYPILHELDHILCRDEEGGFFYPKRTYKGGTKEQQQIIENIEKARLRSFISPEEIINWDPKKTELVTSCIGKYFDAEGNEIRRLEIVSEEYRAYARFDYGTALFRNGNHEGAIKLLRFFFKENGNITKLLTVLPIEDQIITVLYYGKALHMSGRTSESMAVLCRFFNKTHQGSVKCIAPYCGLNKVSKKTINEAQKILISMQIIFAKNTNEKTHSLFELMPKQNQDIANYFNIIALYNCNSFPKLRLARHFFFDTTGNGTTNLQSLSPENQTILRVLFASAYLQLGEYINADIMLRPLSLHLKNSPIKKVPISFQIIARCVKSSFLCFDNKEGDAVNILRPLFKQNGEVIDQIKSLPISEQATARFSFIGALGLTDSTDELIKVSQYFFNPDGSGNKLYNELNASDQKDIKRLLGCAFLKKNRYKDAINLLKPLIDSDKVDQTISEYEAWNLAEMRLCYAIACARDMKIKEALLAFKPFFNADGSGTEILKRLLPADQAMARFHFGYASSKAGMDHIAINAFGRFFDPIEEEEARKEIDRRKEESSTTQSSSSTNTIAMTNSSNRNTHLITTEKRTINDKLIRGREAFSLLREIDRNVIKELYIQSLVKTGQIVKAVKARQDLGIKGRPIVVHL